MKLYFAGSIRAGREDAEVYAQLIAFLKDFGEVLTEHIGVLDSLSFNDEKITDEYIFERDMKWLLSADIVVAEVSVPSLGVGYEIGRAVAAGIPVVCLYRTDAGKRLSAMISGCKDISVLRYSSLAEVYRELPSLIDGAASVSAQKH